jgi:hypothetical protein
MTGPVLSNIIIQKFNKAQDNDKLVKEDPKILKFIIVWLSETMWTVYFTLLYNFSYFYKFNNILPTVESKRNR